jgi:hypothetical protein
MGNRAFVIQAEGALGARIRWTKPGGYTNDGEVYWNDPQAGTNDSIEELVGCKTGPREFMLAYVYAWWSGGTGHSEVRVARIHWNPGDTFSTEVQFPVRIGGIGGTTLAIAPSRDGPGIEAPINGVVVAWETTDGVFGNPPHWVHQQGVTRGGQLFWDTHTNGVRLYADSTTNSYSTLGTRPTIVSTGDGLAVTTFGVVSNTTRYQTTKVDATGNHGSEVFSVSVPTVPGTNTSIVTPCHVVSDGALGAFYAFTQTNGTTTSIVTAHVEQAGSTTSAHATSIWDSSTIDDRLRPLTLLAMPGQAAMVVFRDEVAVKAIKFSGGSGVPAHWAAFIRGASADNLDEAAAVMGSDFAVLLVTSGNEVITHAIVPQTGQPEPNWVPAPHISILAAGHNAWSPRWPHVFTTGAPWNPGFQFGWCEEGDAYGNFYAERFTKEGKPGSMLWTPHATAGGLVDSTVFFDLSSDLALLVDAIEVDLSDSSGSGGAIEIRASAGQSHVGQEQTVASWDLVGSATAVAAGPGLRTRVELSSPFVLPPGTTGIAIRAIGLSPSTIAGTGANQTYAAEELTLQAGSVLTAWPNGPVQPARVFCGGIGYAVIENPEHVATITAYGVGCGSAGPLTLSAEPRPVLGETIALTTTNLATPSTIGFSVLGLVRLPSPIPLPSTGMQCFQYQSLDSVQLMVGAFGQMTSVLTVPNDMIFAGMPVYCQTAARDPHATLFGLSTSNGLDLRLGL